MTGGIHGDKSPQSIVIARYEAMTTFLKEPVNGRMPKDTGFYFLLKLTTLANLNTQIVNK